MVLKKITLVRNSPNKPFIILIEIGENKALRAGTWQVTFQCYFRDYEVVRKEQNSDYNQKLIMCTQFRVPLEGRKSVGNLTRGIQSKERNSYERPLDRELVERNFKE